jgi:S1-C subfamily serine protease
MQLNPWSRVIGLGYLTLVICSSVGIQKASGQNRIDEPPTLAELKTLSYQKTTAPSVSSAPTYQDLMTTIRLARAYAQGDQVLPTYREPVVTRGASGMAVFRIVAPSVVLVVIGEVKNEQFEPSGLGAGVIVNSSGDILTNWHVINGYRGALVFLKPEGGAVAQDSNAYVAQVVAQDEVTDLALLHIVKPPSNLRSVAIGNISSVQVAEDIHVIGHPKGNLWSYSTGVVSQVRDGYDWTYSDGSKHKAKVLQLQTAINPGNSGGPVVDDQDKLIGLVAMGEEGQNLDYAIASDVIQRFLTQSRPPNKRGNAPEPKSPPAEYSSAQLHAHVVLRVSYPDLIEYFISDEKGNAVGLRAETTDGTQLAAWKPNVFGSLGEWAISFRTGVSVRGRGNGAVPDVFGSN